jgi:hypothetical protein
MGSFYTKEPPEPEPDSDTDSIDSLQLDEEDCIEETIKYYLYLRGHNIQ